MLKIDQWLWFWGIIGKIKVHCSGFRSWLRNPRKLYLVHDLAAKHPGKTKTKGSCSRYKCWRELLNYCLGFYTLFIHNLNMFWWFIARSRASFSWEWKPKTRTHATLRRAMLKPKQKSKIDSRMKTSFFCINSFCASNKADIQQRICSTHMFVNET